MAVEAEISGFVAKFTPQLRAQITGCRERMRARFPEAVELVYDNYNFLVFGFGPTPKTSQAIFSLAADRNGVRLFFLQRAPELPDPGRLLRGGGTKVRNLLLPTPDDLDRLDVVALITAACGLATIPMDAAEGPAVVVRSVSAKQRPRQ